MRTGRKGGGAALGLWPWVSCPAWDRGTVPCGNGSSFCGSGRDGEGAAGLGVPGVWLGVSPGPGQLGRLRFGEEIHPSPRPGQEGPSPDRSSLLAQVTRAGDEPGGLRKRL